MLTRTFLVDEPTNGEHNAELDYVVQRATIDGSPTTITISNRDASTADVQIQITNR